MRTNIDIDDNLIMQAMKASNSTTKKAAVETALRQMVQLKKQEGIRKLFGRVQWDGDLCTMRQSRVLEWEESRDAARRRKAVSSEGSKRRAATAR
ncbi:MAG: type II toxin-antitoxin system VapB family antitoxin [Terracidiphilus sp.]